VKVPTGITRDQADANASAKGGYLAPPFIQWLTFPTAPVISAGKFRVPDTTTVDRVRLYRLKK